MPSPVFNLQRWIDQKNEVKAKETKKKAKKSVKKGAQSTIGDFYGLKKSKHYRK